LTYFLYNKDPAESANLIVDWSTWLEGDVISFSNWFIPTDLSSASSGLTAASTNIWIEGGILGEHYALSNTITTSTGRIAKRTIILRITST
jgi:hypothetical protein